MPINLNISNIQDIRLQSTEINKVYLGTKLVYVRTHNIFVFEVDAGQTMKLQPPGDEVPLYETKWGDGATGGFEHTYANAGIYTVTTNCRLVSCAYVEAASEEGGIQQRAIMPDLINYQYDMDTLLRLIEVKSICNAYRNLDGFFYECVNLDLEKISFGEHFYYNKIISACEMFKHTGNNV